VHGKGDRKMMESTESWQLLGRTPAADLKEARLQLHWAAQIPAAAAASLAQPAADDSHLALAWTEGLGALLTVPLPDGRRAGLVLARAELILVGESGVVDKRLSLNGQTLTQGLDWLVQQVAAGQRLDRPGHEMPAHKVGSGEPFHLDSLEAAMVEFSGWYSDASRVLERVVATSSQASPVQCWPHHFDIATLQIAGTDPDPEKSRSVGMGMTPGDGGFPDPYFYVLPWPRPGEAGLPELAGGGQWVTDDWLGAVLHADALRQHRDAPSQARQVEEFITSAHAAALKLVNGGQST
jgi:hypothetical protein